MTRINLIAFALSYAVMAGPPLWAGAASGPKGGSRSIPILEEAAAQAAGLSPEELKDAGKLYTTKCMRCHKSYEPAVYSQKEWDSWMGKMRKKAKLTPGQEQLLARYLDAYRAGSPSVHTNRASAPVP